MTEPQPEKFPEDEAFPLEDTTPIEEQKTPSLVFSNSTYEMLRFFVELLLPGLATFYTTIAAIWNLPGSEQVSPTITALTVLLGLIVRNARRSYNKSDIKFDGAVRFTDVPEQQRVDMNLAFGNVDPKTLMDKKEVVLKVSPPPAP